MRAAGLKTKLVIPDDENPADAYRRASAVLQDPEGATVRRRTRLPHVLTGPQRHRAAAAAGDEVLAAGLDDGVEQRERR